MRRITKIYICEFIVYSICLILVFTGNIVNDRVKIENNISSKTEKNIISTKDYDNEIKKKENIEKILFGVAISGIFIMEIVDLIFVRCPYCGHKIHCLSR